jgi:hypothetical protein
MYFNNYLSWRIVILMLCLLFGLIRWRNIHRLSIYIYLYIYIYIFIITIVAAQSDCRLHIAQELYKIFPSFSLYRIFMSCGYYCRRQRDRERCFPILCDKNVDINMGPLIYFYGAMVFF